MSDRDDPRPDLGPEERQALEALGQMSYPSATADAEDRARRAFLSGAVPAGSSASSAAPRRSRSAFAGLALAAAAALALFGWWGASPTGSWTATDVIAPHGVSLSRGCGEPGETVSPGRIAVSDTSEYEIQLGRDLRLRLLAGTEVELPTPPGRWFARNRTLRVHSGEVYGTTAGPLGFTLRLETDEAVAELSGTTFAVFRTDEATCFCLYEGSLDIVSLITGEPVEIVPGQRTFVYRDGRSPATGLLPPMERAKLSMIDDAGVLQELPPPPN